ncbi:MAG: WD40/YVTN/BNR-like repeat-containing protein [Fimbriimonadaceae bacterium]
MKPYAFFAFIALAAMTFGQDFDPTNYKDLRWTSVGPARGGRSIACTGVRTRPAEFYFGATGGGLWKTTDSGVKWTCVSDGFFKTSSVGAVAVCDAKPDVVYAGMGEREIRGDTSEGDGVYKSIDAGKTWKHVGLEDTRNISRIVVDPKNPDIVYVAALGHLFGSGPDRGVYKSTDGGKTWSQILFESDIAGAVELVMDPADANTLYAATWEAWRTPSHMNSGGPGSKFFKTTDAGAHWTDITRNKGLPEGVIGKIGISVCAANHKRVWAIVEAKEGGIFRSEDAGNTWAKISDDHELTQRAWYFNHIYADPKDANKVYVLNVGSSQSKNAGKTWTGFRTTHSDNHDLWINPDDPKKMIEANDGGSSVSTDGGLTWSPEAYATAEIYHVVADNHIPYRIYGAQQDNSSLKVSPSEFDRPNHHNWEGTAGGESGYLAVRADDPEIVYGGNYSGEIEELNYRTGLGKNINPWPDNPMGLAANQLKHRIQWTFPIVMSPHDPNVLYTASQYLLKTTDDGQSWQQISPDLTRNDPSKQVSSGGPLTQDNTSIEYYDTIFTVAESPVQNGQIWVGSDDGLVHLTRDGGRTWEDVTPFDMPHWGRVSMVEASPLRADTAYIAVNNYQNDDDKPYIYRTHDYGQTWTKIVTGIPDGSFARVCRADLHRAGLLYAGTETGAYVSFDDGNHWQSLQSNLPICPVHDLLLKDDDLIAATHGRSFWIMHDISRLAELTATKLTAPTLYKPLDQVRLGGAARVRIDYFIPGKVKDVKLVVLDHQGRQVGVGVADPTPGVHSERVNLGHAPFGSFAGMHLWAGYPRQIPAPPGAYTVKLTVDGRDSTAQVKLLKDPRAPCSVRDLERQYAFSVTVVERIDDANGAVMRIRDAESQIDKRVKDSKNDPAVLAAANALKAKLTNVEGEIYQYRTKSGEDPLNFGVRLNDRLAGVVSVVQSGQMAPSRQAQEVFAGLSKLLQVQLDRLKSLEAKDVSAFNALLASKNLKPVEPKTPPFAVRKPRTRRRGEEQD